MKLKDYAQIIGDEEVENLHALSDKLSSRSMLHINSTSVGGGVAEILNRLVPLLNDVGVDARWSVMKGGEEFFKVTKSFHNALHGSPVKLNKGMLKTYLEYNRMNADEIIFDRDVIFVHDPQPAAMINKREEVDHKWVWRCHIDISNPMKKVWMFLKRYIEKYDFSIFSMPSFSRSDLLTPQFMIPPSIDPLSDKNRHLSNKEMMNVLNRYDINLEKPIIAQIGRFDRFKDPLGVINTYKIVKKRIDCQLLLAGGTATDDPEGIEVFEEVKEAAGEDRDIHLLTLPQFSDMEINVFQTAATVILQKSTKEGFGLTVSEALWKSTPVVGSAVGGIPSQIIDGVNGFLVHSIDGAANRVTYLLRNPEKAKKMGENGHRYVKQRFLLPRTVKDYLLIMHFLEHPEESFIQL